MESDYSSLMERLDGNLRTADWFSDGWETRLDTFPKSGGSGLQLFRDLWFNQDGMGIHFETWITDREMQQKKTRLVLHVLHQDTFPGTRLKRAAFSRPFVKEARGMIETWKGYKVSNSTMKVFSRDVRFGDDDLIEKLSAEFAKVQQLGCIVDRILHDEIGVRGFQPAGDRRGR